MLTKTAAAPVAERVCGLINTHDLDGLVEMFTADYESVQPAHPLRAFEGPKTVRQHWANFFDAIPDFAAEIVNSVADDKREWVEWRWYGTTTSGESVEIRGVVVWELDRGRVRAARLYMEPVETATIVHAIGD
jgi:ketosteroid isomerase-like protein